MLPLGDNQHRQRITHHVQRGTRHIEDTVDAGNKGKPFQRDPDATQGGQQHHEGDARHAGDPFRGHHQGQHQGNLLPDREVNTVQLGDKARRDALIQR